jgi:hypothetical protein
MQCSPKNLTGVNIIHRPTCTHSQQTPFTILLNDNVMRPSNSVFPNFIQTNELTKDCFPPFLAMVFCFVFLLFDSYWFFDLYLPFDSYLLFFTFCTLLMQFVSLDNIRLVLPHGIPFDRTTLCLYSFISL